jgi:hypothetical protein
MKRLFAAAGVGLGMLTTAAPAHAIEFGTPAQSHPYRSPQNFALELRFSPYRPQIDDEPGLNGTPYADAFGSGAKLYVGLEFDWQTFRIPYVGTIGPGIGVGRVSTSREALTKTTNRESGDEYNLTIYPMYLAAILRADAFWRDRGFPLVPYAKLGVGYGIWRASTTGGTSEFDGVSGKGSTWGTHMAAGLSFALDAIDQGATRNMDNALGINNTYVYAEYYWLNLNGMFQESALHVGTNTWAAGLAFEF